MEEQEKAHSRASGHGGGQHKQQTPLILNERQAPACLFWEIAMNWSP